jgi:hypothetical protein
VDKRRLYTMNRMVAAGGREHPALMHPSTASSHSVRPADNELYDRGCDLVEAAAAIRRLAGEPRAARAVPAVLGCLEAALEELSGACIEMPETTERAAATSTADAVAQRMRRGFINLELALLDAKDAARAARSLAARSLGG